MYGSRYFTSRYFSSRYFLATGGGSSHDPIPQQPRQWGVGQLGNGQWAIGQWGEDSIIDVGDGGAGLEWTIPAGLLHYEIAGLIDGYTVSDSLIHYDMPGQ